MGAAEGHAHGRRVTKPPRFVVVGGGTAGWLTALILQASFRPSRHARSRSRSWSRPSSRPSASARARPPSSARCCASSASTSCEFLRETAATIKFGIRHKDWRRVGYTYDGPIDDPHLVVDGPGYDGRFPWLDVFSVAAGRPVAEKHLFQHLIDGERSPFARKPDGALIPAGPYHHAYHFDQALVGAWLRRKSRGIAVIDAQVTGADRDPLSGDVTALRLDEGDPVPGDVFFDCTGFRRALIAREMGATWQSFSDRMPVNRAMPFWLDIAPGAELPPYTLAWARDAGWMWSIPTQGRIGCGYVYSDRFLDPEGAKAEIERALGHPIEPRNDIRFDPGRLDRVAIGNVIALGLSSAFLEPLEATSIHGTVVQLLMLAPMLRDGRLSRGRPRRLQRHRRPPGRRLPRLHQPALRHRARRHPVLGLRPRRMHRRPDPRAPRALAAQDARPQRLHSRSPAASPTPRSSCTTRCSTASAFSPARWRRPA